MRTLLVLRHGKSSWADEGVEDHDRPLKGRGRRSAKRIGEELQRRDLVPERIVTSTAKRARDTAARAAASAGFEGPVEQTRELYFGGVDGYLHVLVERARDADRRVMLVGHNPDCEDVVERLSGQREQITTANLACIEFDVESWKDVVTTRGTLRFVLRPKELESGARK